MRAVRPYHHRNHYRRKNGPDIGARVENARGESTLLFGEPFTNRLDGRGEIPGLPKTQTKARDRKPEQAESWTHRRMEHPEETPNSDGQCVADPRAEAVDDGAHGEHADSVGRLERDIQCSEVAVGPVENLILQRRS